VIGGKDFHRGVEELVGRMIRIPATEQIPAQK
jgi:hypothetical protein